MHADAGALGTWFPDVHKVYRAHMDALRSFDPTLKGPSPYSSFAASTINLGPKTVCYSHCDLLNLIFGLCLVFVFGKFNPAKGGHLVIHELKLIIELAPGDIFLFPSGCFTHQNIPIQPDETRFSLTAYSAGGLFRFCAQGFQTQADQRLHDPVLAMQQSSQGEGRWKYGCSLYSTLDELFAHWDPDSVPL